jgi:hypothetical protein
VVENRPDVEATVVDHSVLDLVKQAVLVLGAEESAERERSLGRVYVVEESVEHHVVTVSDV